MKQSVLLHITLFGLWLTTAPVLAQGDGPGRSRLEIGRRSVGASAGRITMPTTGTFRFLRQPVLTGLDRSLTLRANAPVNEYFRTLLMARSVSPSRPVPVRTAAVESSLVAVTSESRVVSDEQSRAEERLFSNEQIMISNIYPNPANDVAELDYQVVGNVNEARVMLLDVLGSPVANFVLDRSDRKLRLNTRDLPTGYYFYQLTLDGRKVATKKLLVRHQ
jgi:Secretion system C-terminal sorting domain